jgi:signal transduction histidine kinase
MHRRFGWAVAATGLYVAASVALAYAQFGPSRAGGGTAWVCVLGLVPLGLGWLIVARAPAGPVGPALAWLAAFMVATPAVEAWGRTAGSAAPWWGSDAVAVVGAGAWPWQLVGFLILLLVFPDGLLPGRRWAAVTALVPAAALVVNTAFVVTMNHHDVPPAHSPVSVPAAVWEPVLFVSLWLLLVVTVLCVASVVVRYRRGDERTRRQLRWLILAAGVIVASMVASWVVTTLGWAGPVAYVPFLLGIVVLAPLAVTVAVLRHDLFEIDRILSDSVAWALTTAIAALVLAGLVVGTGYVTGRDSVIGLTGSVFLVALAVLPLHRRIHDAVGRVLDRDRTVLLGRIRRFVDAVRDGSAEPESVEQVLRDAVGDPGLTLLLTDVGGAGYVDMTGAPATPTGDGVRVPLRTADAEIGLLLLGDGSARLVRRARLAASAARLPLEVSRLRLGLRRALHEVGESRGRLLAVTVAERKRLERDLHDGAQQQIVAVGMQLRAAQHLLPPGHAVLGELDLAVDRLEHTVGELRRLAHGVRPASLDDGLAAALRRLGADSPVPIRFTVPDVTPSEVIATTAYFVAAEAVANVLKHADATRIDVTVREADGRLHLAVSDDGVGGVPANGLTALRDRVDSVGGTLAVTSPPRAGTRIEAVLPCAS